MHNQPLRSPKHTAKVKLSEVVSRPGIYTNSKRLNVPNHGIGIIDTISDKYRKIEQLNLKNNIIEHLGEIRQFAHLRLLDLSNNSIADQRQLLHLGSLRNLEVLHISGNPFLLSRLTTQVMAILEQLGCQLNIEVPHSSAKPEQQERLENVLLENYTDLIFIQSLYRKTEVHFELANNYNMDQCDDPDYRYLMKYKDLILDLDHSTAQRFLQQLRLDAYALKKTLNLPDLKVAYRNLIDKQIEKRQQLIGLVDKGTKSLADIRQKKRRALSGLKRDDSNVAFSPKNSRNMNETSLSRTTKKEEIIQPQILHTKKKLRGSLSEQNYQAIYYKNLTKRNPVYHLLYSPLHSLKPKEKDLLIETLSAHLKEKSIQLYRKEELIRHTEETQRLKFEDLTEQINILTEQKCQLTKRLLEYEATMKDIHFDAKGKLRLEKEIDRRQTQLVDAQANGELYKEMYEKVCKGVEYMAQVDKKQEDLTDISHQKRKTRYFELLKLRFEKLRHLKALHNVNKQRQQKQLQSKAFDILRRNSLIKRITKLKAKQTNHLKVEKSFFSLSTYTRTKINLIKLKQIIQNQRRIDSILTMRSNLSKMAVHRIKITKAIMHYKYKIYARCWRIMKSEWVRYCDETTQPIMVRMAQYRRYKLMIKVMMAWIDQHEQYKKQKIELTKKIYQLKLRRYLNRPFQAWQRQLKTNQCIMEEKEQHLTLLQRAISTKNIPKAFIIKSKVNDKKAKKAKNNLRQLCWKVKKQHIQNELTRKLKQYYLNYSNNRQRCVWFFCQLREQSRRYLGHTTYKLMSTLMIGRAQKLFGFYPKIKEMQNKMINHLTNMKLARSLRTLSRTFEGWRYITIRDKFRSHCQQINPIVNDFKKKEQHYIKMSGILREQLESKDEKLSLYDKKFENLSMEMMNQDMRYQMMKSTFENSLAEMRMRQYEFKEIINKLQNKFDVVSAEVDHLAVDEIKKSYRLRHIYDSGPVGIQSNKIDIRNRYNTHQISSPHNNNNSL